MVERNAQTMTRWLADVTRPVDAVDDIDLLRQVEVRLFGSSTPPLTIGRYALARLLGRGGFGRVYEAEDPELDRRVAVKIVDVASLPTGTDSDAFRHEARALARVRHPHCVSVFDVGSYDLTAEARQLALATGVAPSGVYIVMEFVRGQQLATWLDEPHTVDEVVAVFEQLAGALAAAHAVGVVHGDFKPGNVVIDESGHAQVLDFGLARLLDPLDRADDVGVTDRVVGTPRYMAPEQFGGALATARSDQFSWAASLREAICGSVPERTDTFDEQSPSSTTAQSRTHAALPGWLAPLVERGMDPSASARFDSMDELIVALRRARDRRRVARRGLAAAAAAVGIAAVSVSTLGAEVDQPCPAAVALDSLWNEGSRAEIEAAFLATMRPHAATSWASVRADLDAWADRYAAHGHAVCAAPGESNTAALRCLEEHASRFAGTLGVLAVSDSSNVDDAHTIVATLPDPEDCTPVTRDAGSDVVGQFRAVAAARALRALGRTAEARARAEALLAEPTVHPNAAVEALAVAGRSATLEGDHAGAAVSYRRMLALATEHRLTGAETIALSCLAFNTATLGDAGAARTYEDLARGRLPMHDADVDVSVASLRCLADLEDHRDDHEAFARTWTSIRDQTAARFGEEHPLTLGAAEEIAFGRYRQGDHAGAAELIGPLPERLAARLGEEHPATLDASMLRALVDAELGRVDEAWVAMTRLVDAHERVLGSDHLMTATAFHNAAVIALRADRRTEAVAHAQRGFEIRGRVLGLGAEPTIDTAVTLAAAHRAARRPDGRRDAIAALDRVLGPGRERLGDLHPVVLRARSVRLFLLAADDAAVAGLVDEARLLVEHARRGRQDPAIELIAMRTLATALDASGRLVEAAEVCAELRDRECDRPTPNPRHCAEAELYETVTRLELGQIDALAEVRDELARYAEIPGALDRDRWYFQYRAAVALERHGHADEAAIEYTAAIGALEPDAAPSLTQARVAWGIARLAPHVSDARRRELGNLARSAFEGEGEVADAKAVAVWLEALPGRP